MRWSEEDMKFLRDNHRKLSPKEMENDLNRTYNSIANKMHSMKLKNANAIYSEQNRLFMDRLIFLGMSRHDIAELTGFTLETVNVKILRREREEEANRKANFKPKHRAFHYNEIRLINSAGLNGFKANDEWELYRYRDLSPSEQVIYHGLQNNEKQTA